MKFYGIGTRKYKDKKGNHIQTDVRFSLTATTFLGATNEANRIAKQERAVLQYVRLENSNSNRYNGGLLTKNIKEQKRAAHAKQKLREKENRQKGK